MEISPKLRIFHADMGYIRKYAAWAACMLLLLSGCQSLDDDSPYEIKTWASFFLVGNVDGTLRIDKYIGNSIEPEWNAKAGMPNAELSDAQMLDNAIWLASGVQRAVTRVSPTYASVQEKFGDLPIAPHYLAVGTKQIMIADTAANKVAMIKRSNGNVQVLEFEGHPGRCVYGSGKFYLVVDHHKVAIYDEQAMTTRATLDLKMQIDDLLLNRYNFVVPVGHDSLFVTQEALVDVNGDGLVREFPTTYTKTRLTPYFAVRFGAEYVHDLQLKAGKILTDNAVALTDSTTDFEVDFFEGTLFYIRNGHFVVRDIATGQRADSLPFQGFLHKAMHQYADE